MDMGPSSITRISSPDKVFMEEMMKVLRDGFIVKHNRLPTQEEKIKYIEAILPVSEPATVQVWRHPALLMTLCACRCVRQ